MDLESESESDGGMQLDEVSMDSSSEGEADPGQNTRLDIDNSHPEGWDIVGHIETPGDTGSYLKALIIHLPCNPGYCGTYNADALIDKSPSSPHSSHAPTHSIHPQHPN